MKRSAKFISVIFLVLHSQAWTFYFLDLKQDGNLLDAELSLKTKLAIGYYDTFHKGPNTQTLHCKRRESINNAQCI